ncbi:MAG: DegQ family serine endoprotease [Acidobacteriota bacterium]|nr:DegQ family serine endoprotease [Blastocatellia bacterium]MDW8238036.1 DegQ family serine endoprotease [Acidobacteriota bacterium]
MGSIGFRSRRWAIALGGAVMLAVGILAGTVMTAYTSWNPFHQKDEQKVPIYVATNTPGLVGNLSLEEGLAPLARAVRQSVVSISLTKVVRGQPIHPFMDDPFFRRFFGDDFEPFQPRQRREAGLGSGVIISPDGYILTNNHVVEGASEVKVTLADKREMTAKIIGTDAPTDVAVIKIDAKDLPAMPLGDSRNLQVGEFVLAVGNPFGLGHTVTFGIISATGRGNLNIADYGDFIQTDAAINPGNSGGALVNMRGQLIGINTAIKTSGFAQGNIGIGFAIPIHMARDIMDQLLRTGSVVRGYLGLLPQDVTPAIAEQFGLKSPKGALVASVTEGTPAAQSGIQNGDVIVEYNGRPVEDANSLRNMVAETAPGTSVKIKLLRDGSERTVTVKVGTRPGQQQARTGQDLNRENALSGIRVEELTPTLRRQLNLPASVNGVVVTDVDPESSAADEEIVRGHIIQEINRRPIRSVADFQAAAAQAGNKNVLVLVYDPRSTVSRYVVLKPRQ